MAQKTVNITSWTTPPLASVYVTAFPIGGDTGRHPDLADRVTLALDMGVAMAYLRPTANETRALIALLEWALSAPPADEEAAIERRRVRMIADLEQRFAEVAL